MKFKTKQSDLNTHLSLVSHAVPSRPTHAVLGNILFAADDQSQRVDLTAFDLSISIHTSFAAEVSKPGKLTLPAKLLGDIVARLPKGEITIASVDDETEDNDGIVLSSETGQFKIMGMSSDEFPALPVAKAGKIVLPVEVLKEGLHGCLFAASGDETKQVLTGVHIQTTEQGYEFAATDGHRLAVVKLDIDNYRRVLGDNDLNDLKMTIPARALRELDRIMDMPCGDKSVALYLGEGLAFERGDQRLTCRKLEGAYPAYDQLIPSSFSRTVTMDRNQLLSALELVAIVANLSNNRVKCKFDSENSQIKLSVDAQDIGYSDQTLPIEITGETIEVGFDTRYFIQGLKAIPVPNIQIQLNECNQPVIITPLGGIEMIHLMMPMQIR